VTIIAQGVSGMNAIARFIGCNKGATAIEYALIASGIAVTVIVAVNGLGTNLNALFTKVQNNVK